MSFLALRDDREGHRQATWLELFFDLAFVTCIGQASHLLISDHSWNGIFRFVSLFIPVWWIWNQFTWYASHFDNDDVFFRLLMLTGTGGAIILQGTFPHQNEVLPFIRTYLGLHAAIGLAWARVFYLLPEIRSYAGFKLSGIILGIVFWSIAMFQTGSAQLNWMIGGTFLQLLMPIIAWQAAGATITVHGHHIFERHGLFTIIVLGESLLGLASFAKHPQPDLMVAACSIFVSIVSMWWIYFDWDFDTTNLKSTRKAFAYNYGQLFIYGMLTIFAAGAGAYLLNDKTGADLIVAGCAGFILSILSINFLAEQWRWIKIAKIYLLAAGVLVSMLSLNFFSIVQPEFLVYGATIVTVGLGIGLKSIL